MSDNANRKVVLNKRPQGEIANDDLVIREEPVRELKDGEVLLKTLWLSLDPYMRPRMNDSKGYMDPIEIGATIVGESVGRVVESKSPKYSVGDVVTSYSGWQEYSIISGDAPMVYKIKDQGVPLQAYLGVAGMPGRTGYCGLTRGQAQSRRNRSGRRCIRPCWYRGRPDRQADGLPGSGCGRRREEVPLCRRRAGL